MHWFVWPQRLLLKSITLAATASLVFATACTEEPKNDGDAKSPPPRTTIDPNYADSANKSYDEFKTSSTTTVDPNQPKPKTPAELEELKQANLRKPIIYGVGAGGIDMDTTFAESKDLLTPPFRGPFANGLALYDEQLIVIWKDEGERKPQLIIPIRGYLGKLSAGKFGNLDFQTKFKDYKGDKPEQGAARLIRELYLELENPDDKNYDCLTTGQCSLIYGTIDQANMVMIFPGAVFLIAKEEFQLAEIRIVRYVKPGQLANNLDIISGDILVPNEKPFSLGQTYKEIFARLQPEILLPNPEIPGAQTANVPTENLSPEIYVRTDFIGYSWSGVWYSFHRSNFSLEVATAEETDRAKTVEVSPMFPSPLTVSGARILLDDSSGELVFSLEQGNESEEILANALTMNRVIPQKRSMEYMEKFNALITAELSKKYDQVTARLDGFQNPEKIHREITSVIQAFNSSDLRGVRIIFRLNEEQEKLAFFSISQLDTTLKPLDALTLPPAPNDLVLTKDVFADLDGIRLNDAVLLTDIDALGRQEATIQYFSAQNPAANNLVERTIYIEQGVFEEPDENRLKPRVQSFVQVGGSGTVLGLKTVASDVGMAMARVVSVSTSNIYGKIQGICGLNPDFHLKIGMTDEEVLGRLLEAIAAKQAADPAYKCDHLKIRDNGSLGFIKEIYFPKERLVLTFSNRGLSTVSIYIPFSDIDMSIPEVAQ